MSNLKPDWPAGPWTNEPDELAFEAHGLKCVMLRIDHHGAWCGYVQAPEGHPRHGANYTDFDEALEVHGGLTFSGPLRGQEGHWMGFDCKHAWDVALGSPYFGLLDGDSTYRDVDYVRAEVERLAKQMVALQPRDAGGLAPSLGGSDQ